MKRIILGFIAAMALASSAMAQQPTANGVSAGVPPFTGGAIFNSLLAGGSGLNVGSNSQYFSTGFFNTIQFNANNIQALTLALDSSANSLGFDFQRGAWVSTIQAYRLSAGTTPTYTTDAILGYGGVGTFTLGFFPSGNTFSLINQTINTLSARAGTDSNTAAETLTINTGLGTGTGAPTTIAFGTSIVTTSGTGAQTQQTDLTLGSTGTILNVLSTATGSYVCATAGLLTQESVACPASDWNVKQRVETIADSDLIAKMMDKRAVRFDYKPGKGAPGRQIGVVVGDPNGGSWEKDFPELVSYDDDGTRHFNYQQAFGLALAFGQAEEKQLQAQQAEIDALKSGSPRHGWHWPWE